MQTNMLLLLLIAPLVITQRFEWHPDVAGVYPANIVDERTFNELSVGTNLTIVFLNPTKRTAGGDFKIWFTKPMNIDYVTLTVTNSQKALISNSTGRSATYPDSVSYNVEMKIPPVPAEGSYTLNVYYNEDISRNEGGTF